jgi:hypothetical protein
LNSSYENILKLPGNEHNLKQSSTYIRENGMLKKQKQKQQQKKKTHFFSIFPSSQYGKSARLDISKIK